MALQPSQKVKLQEADPAESLKTALESFQNILTEEQKQYFKQNFQQNATTPDAGSVVEFVAQIDAKNSSTTRRCVAPRLCTFLEATQQFVGIVETFVSCNPAIAALVWGGVKFAILTASNVASYFDRVTSMIMGIGKSCPTYQQFGLLYPGCISLQRALCDYYAVIINLCVKIIEVSRRTGLRQALSSIVIPFDSEFKLLLDKIQETKDQIQLQLSLASKQADQEAKKLLRYESEQNSRFRSSALNFFQRHQAEASQLRIDSRKRETAKLKTRIRINLSPVNHVSPWRQALSQRISTTAEWLQKELIFSKWKDDPQTSVLWCSGTIGMGKTVLMSNVVAQLHAVRKSNEILSYYFCRVDNEESLSARNILGSLARQIIDTQIDQSTYETLLALEESSRDLSKNDVIPFLLPRLETDKKYYFILDGLDECEDHQIQAVAQALTELCSSCSEGVKILCAGRPGLEKQLFKSSGPHYKVIVNKEKVESDMDCYITTTLNDCLEKEVLTLRNPAHIVEISCALRDRSHGMFLWVGLCIEELCAQICDDDILEALKTLPYGLSELYDRKLRRVQEGRVTRRQAMKVLEYCGIVKRPLTVMEHREALSLSLEQTAFDHGKMPNDMNKVINSCCGLTFIDEEEDTVHYVHHSVKQHLFITNDVRQARFDIATIDRHFGLLCMTYLDFSNFKRQLTKFKEGSGTLISPIHFATLPIHSSSGVSRELAQKILLQHRKLSKLTTREIERKAQEIAGAEESSRLKFELQKQEFQFLNYARDYWLYHLTDFSEDVNSKEWKLFCRCVGDEVVACRPWEPGQQTHSKIDDIPDSIQWLLARGHYALLLYFTRHRSHVLTNKVKHEVLRRCDIHNRYRYTEALVQLEDTDNILNHGLWYAAADGCNLSLSILLKAGADVDAKFNGQTALQAAAEGGHLKVLQALLAAKADVNIAPTSNNGRTALQAAAEGGHLEVVQALLAAKADINAAPAEFDGRTALQAAAEGGHLEVVQALLVAKADINAAPASNNGRTALQAAAEGGHLEVVQALLVAKADINAAPASNNGRTALQAAAEGGHLEVLQALLAAKADVNIAPASNNGRTALQAAAEGGYLEVLQALLAAKADINAAPAEFDGRTALQAAAEGGYLEVVQALLVAKADINAAPASNNGRTALQAAAKGGHLEVIQALLAAKADINTAPAEFYGRTALQAAAKGGHLKVIQALLAAKADVNIPPAEFYGRTALQAAAEGGQLKVVQALLAAKADINAAPAHKNGRTALQAAAEGGHLKVMQALLAAKADINAAPTSNNGRTALQAAAEGGHLEVVQALLAAKADVNTAPTSNNGRTALQAAAEGGHLEVVQALLAAKADINVAPAEFDGRTALQAAAEGGHLEVMQALLAAKADINAAPAEFDGRTALQAAAEGSHLEVVQALLAAKADVNIAPAHKNGRTALQAAAEGGHLEVIQALLVAKADINAAPAKFNGRTALQAAAEGGHLEVVQALLVAKADVNTAPTNNNGRTALQAAAEGGHLEVIHALLAAKADINAAPAEFDGRTALQAAAEGGHLEVVQVLLAAKADINAAPAKFYGRTALQAAAEGGHLEVMQALKQSGAKL